jgi:hypothetical protein
MKGALVFQKAYQVMVDSLRFLAYTVVGLVSSQYGLGTFE